MHEVKSIGIKTLFLDIGGVLLTNGWGSDFRDRAVQKFGLNKKEMEKRHKMTFDTYEEGKLSLNEYLDRVIFYQVTLFTKEEFRHFMFEQSEELEGSLAFFNGLKKQFNLKVFAVSNEGRELNEYRIKKFKLNDLFDAYISSCYIHLRKPDKGMLQLACDISQTRPQEALYIDDRLMFVEVARAFGIPSIHFQSLDSAKEQISKLSFHTR
jgi:putative hydrolase of the HAD superfamily